MLLFTIVMENRATSQQESSTASSAVPNPAGRTMKPWMRVGATVLCLPCLLLYGFIGTLMLLGPLISKHGMPEMVPMGALLLVVAAQAALTIWSSWRRPSPGICRFLFWLSIGTVFVAAMVAATRTTGVDPAVKPLMFMILLASAGAGLAIARASSGSTPPRTVAEP